MVEILLTDISLKLNTYSQDAYVNMRFLGFLLLVADLAPVDVFALLLIDARDVRADVGGDILALLLDRVEAHLPGDRLADGLGHPARLLHADGLEDVVALDLGHLPALLPGHGPAHLLGHVLRHVPALGHRLVPAHVPRDVLAGLLQLGRTDIVLEGDLYVPALLLGHQAALLLQLGLLHVDSDGLLLGVTDVLDNVPAHLLVDGGVDEPDHPAALLGLHGLALLNRLVAGDLPADRLLDVPALVLGHELLDLPGHDAADLLGQAGALLSRHLAAGGAARVRAAGQAVGLDRRGGGGAVRVHAGLPAGPAGI